MKAKRRVHEKAIQLKQSERKLRQNAVEKSEVSTVPEAAEKDIQVNIVLCNQRLNVKRSDEAVFKKKSLNVLKAVHFQLQSCLHKKLKN